MNTPDSIPNFFRVYMPNETNDDDMKLPFVSSEISGTPLPRKITVKNVSSGNVWRMEMTTDGESDSVILRDGWKKIITDKNLKDPIILVCEFDGSRLFHFCVYEHGSMCKKLKSPMENEVIEVESDETDEEEDDDDDAIEEDEESIEELNKSPNRKERGGTSMRRSYLKKDSAKFIEYLDDKLNPFFPVDVNQERTRIPAVLIKDYSLKFHKSVIVSDKINELERKIAVWENRSVFLKGVGSIMRRNNVKPGDKVVFELKMVDGYRGLVREIKVHIIKA